MKKELQRSTQGTSCCGTSRGGAAPLSWGRYTLSTIGLCEHKCSHHVRYLPVTRVLVC